MRFTSANGTFFCPLFFLFFYHFLYVHMYWSDECSPEERKNLNLPLFLRKYTIFLIYMPQGIIRTLSKKKKKLRPRKSGRCVFCRYEIVITDSEVSTDQCWAILKIYVQPIYILYIYIYTHTHAHTHATYCLK